MSPGAVWRRGFDDFEKYLFHSQNIVYSFNVIALMMKKPVFMGQRRFSLISLLTALIFSGFQSAAKQEGSIILKDEPVPATPKEFYIANVIDQRDNRNAVAWLLTPAGGENPPKTYTADFRGGGLNAIKEFIDHNLPHNKALRPVIIGLKKFMLEEKSLAGGRVEGQVSVVMSFNLERDDDEMLYLLDYKGNAIYTRTAGPAQEIEPTLRHMLETGLVYLNTWMNQQADINVKLAKAVKINFTDYTEKLEGDSIYYSVNRPLSWNDFKSNTPAGRFDAQVFPTIGYDEHTEVIKGVINVNLAIKVCLPKSAAWVRDGSKNDYVLNHEQRHFDIVKIVAEHFKRKINAENLTVDNYEGIINSDYLNAYREMDSLQKQYDDETRHGSDQQAQQQWNEKIDKELKGFIGSLVH